MAKLMSAKYAGKCKACNGRISVGMQISWSREGGAKHVGCASAKPAPASAESHPLYDAGDENDWARERARENAEYEAGRADAERYMSDKALYGEELAEQWAIEDELRHSGDY